MAQMSFAAVLVGLIGAAYAQSLKGSAATDAQPVKLEDVHYPPDFHPPTTVAAWFAFAAVFLIPIFGIIGMTYAKEGGYAGAATCLLITLVWAILAFLSW
eukprot:TRINITY_DN78991_c0_g1_i1.p2 TRINITY_DN78991_c0_g1~~TRINITY_DN78991_c0_g1_i1.p2  ORF type:complete len:100 (+),score=28.39 TRINITY_DN78991_c0_g1_i1:87-386(+)